MWEDGEKSAEATGGGGGGVQSQKIADQRDKKNERFQSNQTLERHQISVLEGQWLSSAFYCFIKKKAQLYLS